MQKRNIFFHRISQLIGFILGARFFVTALLTFALYVSTFFLFSKEESLRNFVFEFKVHGIIFCAILSVLAGGIINQFYDREKDVLTKPFRFKVQNFLKQKYFLYAYLCLSILALIISWLISPRVFLFFLVYQFLMWFYSHKLSKVLIINNLTFVSLSLYPFFGMLIYYQTFSKRIFLMAAFLFIILLVIDILKDTLTKNADKILGYRTIPNVFGKKVTFIVVYFLLVLLLVVSVLLIQFSGLHNTLSYYFALGLYVFLGLTVYLGGKERSKNYFAMNILRVWVFVGICAMLLDGIQTKI